MSKLPHLQKKDPKENASYISATKRQHHHTNGKFDGSWNRYSNGAMTVTMANRPYCLGIWRIPEKFGLPMWPVQGSLLRGLT